MLELFLAASLSAYSAPLRSVGMAVPVLDSFMYGLAFHTLVGSSRKSRQCSVFCLSSPGSIAGSYRYSLATPHSSIARL